jgi:hypothetical protein
MIEHNSLTSIYCNSDSRVLTGKTNILFIELSKLDRVLQKPIDEMTGLENWCIFGLCEL